MSDSVSSSCTPPAEAAKSSLLLAPGGGGGDDDDDDDVVDDPDETRVTCDVLCSLGGGGGAASSYSASANSPASSTAHDDNMAEPQKFSKHAACPKQHQLPMFLSKTYHMMDRCDPEIATWSSSGDNFVVKDVEQFSTKVLPLYFKHSNFSSFARQLNFYGFRKLRTDPILTSDVDPSTASYVRFYHDKFQKDKPELLHHIKRATKSDQQSKDDVDSLKGEVTRLRDCITHMSMDMDRKLMEMSYEYNKRITALSAEYDKLAGLVSQFLTDGGSTSNGRRDEATDAAVSATCRISRGNEMMQSLSRVAAMGGAVLPSLSSSTEDALPSACLGSRGVCRLGVGGKRPAPEDETPACDQKRRGCGAASRSRLG